MQGGDILQQKEKLMLNKTPLVVVDGSWQVEGVGGCLCKAAA